MLPLSPLIYLSIAAVLNLNNWTYYYYKICEMETGKLVKFRIINIITMMAVCFYIGFFVGVFYLIIKNAENSKKVNQYSEKILNLGGFNFIFIGLAFGFVGVLTNYRLKIHFNSFYD